VPGKDPDEIEATKPSRSNRLPSKEGWASPVEEGVGYHQQARVENTFFRYKSIIGDRGPASLA
jgi:hypothetical protein